MTEIKLSPNDQKDLLDLLAYALEKKKDDKGKDSFPKYWAIRIPQLMQIIKGWKVYDTIYQSSLGNLVGDIERGMTADDSYY